MRMSYMKEMDERLRTILGKHISDEAALSDVVGVIKGELL